MKSSVAILCLGLASAARPLILRHRLDQPSASTALTKGNLLKSRDDKSALVQMIGGGFNFFPILNPTTAVWSMAVRQRPVNPITAILDSVNIMGGFKWLVDSIDNTSGLVSLIVDFTKGITEAALKVGAAFSIAGLFLFLVSSALDLLAVKVTGNTKIFLDTVKLVVAYTSFVFGLIGAVTTCASAFVTMGITLVLCVWQIILLVKQVVYMMMDAAELGKTLAEQHGISPEEMDEFTKTAKTIKTGEKVDQITADDEEAQEAQKIAQKVEKKCETNPKNVPKNFDILDATKHIPSAPTTSAQAMLEQSNILTDMQKRGENGATIPMADKNHRNLQTCNRDHVTDKMTGCVTFHSYSKGSGYQFLYDLRTDWQIAADEQKKLLKSYRDMHGPLKYFEIKYKVQRSNTERMNEAVFNRVAEVKLQREAEKFAAEEQYLDTEFSVLLTEQNHEEYYEIVDSTTKDVAVEVIDAQVHAIQTVDNLADEDGNFLDQDFLDLTKAYKFVTSHTDHSKEVEKINQQYTDSLIDQLFAEGEIEQLCENC